jgi:hypothetical protein
MCPALPFIQTFGGESEVAADRCDCTGALHGA